MGSVSVIKKLMMLFNLLFLLAGLGLVGAGIWVFAGGSNFNFGVSGNISVIAGALAIAIGAVVALVAFLGCCGAWKESTCMLYCFNVFLVIFILIEVGIAAAVWYLAPNLSTYLEGPAKEVIKNSYGLPGQEDSITKLYDDIHQQHKCCGFSGGSDFEGAAYLDIPLTTTYHNPWPQSCCEPDATAVECRDNPVTKSYHETGCFKFVQDLLQRYSNVIGGVMVGVAALQLVAMIFAYCIACSTGKNTVGPY